MSAAASTPQDDGALCRQLIWDSEFFQQKIARAAPERVTEESLSEIKRWCSANRIDCLYFLATPNDPESIRLLEHSGFDFVDIRTTLEISIGKLNTEVESPSRHARASDIPALRAIAGVSHGDSRFYNDGHFSAEQCRALFETWIENSVKGWAQAVLIAELDEEPAGYVTCHLSPGVAEIGLLAVAGSARGEGLGGHLVSAALRWFAQQGTKKVTVVTQGRNVRAQRLYEKSGFIVRSIQHWYHYWPAR